MAGKNTTRLCGSSIYLGRDSLWNAEENEERRTMNEELKTKNDELKTQNSKLRTQNSELKTR